MTCTATGMASAEHRNSMTHSWLWGLEGAVRLATIMASRWLLV